MGSRFPCVSAGKESIYYVGDLGSIPGLGRSSEEGKGYPLQYSGLENSMDYVVHGVAKSWTWLSDFHFNFSQHKGFLWSKFEDDWLKLFPLTEMSFLLLLLKFCMSFQGEIQYHFIKTFLDCTPALEKFVPAIYHLFPLVFISSIQL